MPRPAGLTWEDRIGTDDEESRWWFDCHRKGHPKVSRVFDLKADAKDFRAEHDAEYHSRFGRANRGRPVASLGPLLDEHFAYLQGLQRRGVRSKSTLWQYAYHHRSLKRCMGARMDALTIGRPDLSRYVEARFAEGGTEGGVIVKELKALKAAIAWRYGAGAVGWKVPVDDIKPKRTEPRKLSREELAAFVAHLDGEARVIVLLKLRTGLHNVEIERLLVGDIDTERRVLFTLVAKKAHGELQPHAFPLADDIAGELAPLVAGRDPEEHVFKRRQIRSLRDYFIEASTAAGIKPPITAIGVLRHHFLTWSTNSFGTAATSRAIGHRSEYTTSKYLLDDGDLDAKRKIADAVASLVPIGGTTGGTSPSETKGIQWNSDGRVVGITAKRHNRNALKR